ncbi:hypothetical protein ON010_g8146 [Phytophthora cinnamomi]|nr:hypothetical protein ON010_g8146 [Phytophthora cinnamomi]
MSHAVSAPITSQITYGHHGGCGAAAAHAVRAGDGVLYAGAVLVHAAIAEQLRAHVRALRGALHDHGRQARGAAHAPQPGQQPLL